MGGGGGSGLSPPYSIFSGETNAERNPRLGDMGAKAAPARSLSLPPPPPQPLLSPSHAGTVCGSHLCPQHRAQGRRTIAGVLSDYLRWPNTGGEVLRVTYRRARLRGSRALPGPGTQQVLGRWLNG